MTEIVLCSWFKAQFLAPFRSFGQFLSSTFWTLPQSMNMCRGEEVREGEKGLRKGKRWKGRWGPQTWRHTHKPALAHKQTVTSPLGSNVNKENWKWVILSECEIDCFSYTYAPENDKLILGKRRAANLPDNFYCMCVCLYLHNHTHTHVHIYYYVFIFIYFLTLPNTLLHCNWSPLALRGSVPSPAL